MGKVSSLVLTGRGGIPRKRQQIPSSHNTRKRLFTGGYEPAVATSRLAFSVWVCCACVHYRARPMMPET